MDSDKPVRNTDSSPVLLSSILHNNDSHPTRDPSESSHDPTPPSSRDVEDWADNCRHGFRNPNDETAQERPISGDARQNRGNVGQGGPGRGIDHLGRGRGRGVHFRDGTVVNPYAGMRTFSPG